MDLFHRARRVSLLLALAVAVPGGLAFAQVDLTGEWRALMHEDVNHRVDDPNVTPGIRGAEGSRLGDYTGLPLNDAARLRADSWDPRIWSAREHQTVLHPGAYWALAPGGLRISKAVDPVTQRILSYTVYRFVRHDSVLTLIAIVTDPVYLTEPLVETVSWMPNLRQQLSPPPLTTITDELLGQPKTFVPHFLPGQNRFLHEFSEAFGIPFEATRGGAATMYPEYQQRLMAIRATASRSP